MPTYDLGLEHVSLAFATKNIFTDVTQGVFEGDRIGIVGKNGDGKSTLLHLFKGTQEPDSGRVTMRNGLTFGMLDQRDPLDDNATVREAALEGREDYEWAAETRSREIVEALLGGISLDAKIGSPVRRTAPPRRLGTPAAQGLGHSRARRAHQPLGRGDDPLARRTLEEPLAVRSGRAAARHPRPLVPR